MGGAEIKAHLEQTHARVEELTRAKVFAEELAAELAEKLERQTGVVARLERAREKDALEFSKQLTQLAKKLDRPEDLRAGIEAADDFITNITRKRAAELRLAT